MDGGQIHNDIVATARRIARQQVAPLAAQYDRTGTFPIESYAALLKTGLTTMNVPRRYGGLEVDRTTYCNVLLEIAKACGSTALTLNMHSTIVAAIGALASPRQREKYMQEAVEGKLFASLTSEPTSSFRGNFSVATAVDRVPGGYRLNGFKFFCSLSAAADYFYVWAMPRGATGLADHVLNLIVPSATAGVEIEETWDTLAMRATASHSVRFTDVFVPDEAVIGGPGAAIEYQLGDRFMLGYAATYLGLAEAAYEHALEFAMSHRGGAGAAVPISHHPTIQRHIATMNVRITAARHMMLQAAERAEAFTAGGDAGSTTAADAELLLALNQAKLLACEAAREVSDLALQVVGGRALYRRGALERIFRDAHVGQIMPPNNDQSLETIGQICLGFDMSAGVVRE